LFQVVTHMLLVDMKGITACRFPFCTPLTSLSIWKRGRVIVSWWRT
jgi:hypothetical protein